MFARIVAISQFLPRRQANKTINKSITAINKNKNRFVIFQSYQKTPPVGEDFSDRNKIQKGRLWDDYRQIKWDKVYPAPELTMKELNSLLAVITS